MPATMREPAMDGPLLEACQRGDREAFRALFEAWQDRVYSLALHFTGDEAAAQDVAQDVFLKLFARIGQFRGESAFGTWLHRLAVNLMLEHRAGLGRDRKRWSSEDEVMGELPAKRVTPDESLDMEDAVQQLPDGMRQVFVLYDVEGYQHDEIGRMLGISTGTSKSQLHRARMALRQLLLR